MDLLQAIILGSIQGTTEWLPISSTGHLRIAERLFGLTVPLLFDVVLHVGTLAVTLIYFRKDIKNILTALWKRNLQSEDGKLIIPIIIGTIPTAIIGALIGNELDQNFNSMLLLGAGFIASGIILFASKLSKETKTKISYPTAFLIGIMQGISIIPSISRSGLTIAVMLLLGIKREIAFRFSFLLSIPAVIGALALTLYQEQGAISLAGISSIELIASLIVTVAISFLALTLLWKTLANKKFHLFAFYCWLIGTALIILSILGF